jgi:hypothetical protein
MKQNNKMKTEELLCQMRGKRHQNKTEAWERVFKLEKKLAKKSEKVDYLATKYDDDWIWKKE